MRRDFYPKRNGHMLGDPSDGWAEVSDEPHMLGTMTVKPKDNKLFGDSWWPTSDLEWFILNPTVPNSAQQYDPDASVLYATVEVRRNYTSQLVNYIIPVYLCVVLSYVSLLLPPSMPQMAMPRVVSLVSIASSWSPEEQLLTTDFLCVTAGVHSDGACECDCSVLWSNPICS